MATLQTLLPVSARCIHVKNHGGLMGAVRDVARNLSRHAYVFRTDVKAYYDSIDHGHLIEKLKRHVTDERILGLIRQYLNRTAERGGIFTTIETKGISRGCALSPLIGAFFLGDLDARLEAQARREGLFYVRYMDDILVLAPTRWKLRRAVASVNQELEKLGLAQHPDKTFIGRIERGFDFLGYHFSRAPSGPVRLSLAAKTVANFEDKLFRLYEQARQAKTSSRSRLPSGTEHAKTSHSIAAHINT